MVEAGWSDAQADCRRVFEENSHPMWVVEAAGGGGRQPGRAAPLRLLAGRVSRHVHRRSLRGGAGRDQGRPGSARARETPEEGRIVHRRGDHLVRGHVRRAAGLSGLRPRRHLPPADGGPDTLSRPLAGDGQRRRGRQRRQVHPHGVECRRRIDLRKTGRRGARAAGRAGVPHRLRRRRARRGDQAVARNGPLSRRADPSPGRRKAHPHRIARRRALRQRRQATRLRQRQPRHHGAQVRRGDHPRAVERRAHRAGGGATDESPASCTTRPPRP